MKAEQIRIFLMLQGVGFIVIAFSLEIASFVSSRLFFNVTGLLASIFIVTSLIGTITLIFIGEVNSSDLGNFFATSVVYSLLALLNPWFSKNINITYLLVGISVFTALGYHFSDGIKNLREKFKTKTRMN